METKDTAAAAAEKTKVRRHRRVPDSLVYEMMDGKPIYYRGYKSVLNKSKKPEDIMGSSSLQALIVDYILRNLHRFLHEDDYWVMVNEPGVHLDKKNNLSADILIYEASRLNPSSININYTSTPANIVIEVDTKADLSILNFYKYLKTKTQKFLDFGVEKVIWVLTTSQQVIIATAGNDWLMIDWNKEIEIMSGLSFNVGKYLSAKGIRIVDDETADS